MTSGEPARLRAYRIILWAALAAYPFFLQGMHAAAGFPSPLVVRGLGYLGLAATCLPAAMALLCLHELTRVQPPETVRRAIGREAVLGAVSPALFVVLNTGLWWVLIGLVFLMKFLPLRTGGFDSEIGTRRIHIGAACVVLPYAVEHIANHLAAVYSFPASDAMMTAFRGFLRIRVVEILLLTAVAVLILGGVRLVAGSRLTERGAFLIDAQILSGAYLAVFLCAHVARVVVVDRLLHGTSALFSGIAGKGVYGMLSSAGNVRLMPFYALSVAATFVHIGGAGRWLLIPRLGDAGAERFARVTIWLGVIFAAAVALPMMQVHLLPANPAR